MPSVYSSSDYAGLETSKAKFYYGYERTSCPVHGDNSADCGEADCDKADWCFVAEFNGEKVVVPYPNLKADCDRWNVRGCLMTGIALMIEKYGIGASP